MTPIQFGLKRAHQTSLRFSHKLLRPFGITPARFDMLRCIERLEYGFQCEIAEALGVSAPTVSRMLKALVELGLVVRARFEEWGRGKIVALTAEGMALVKRAVESLFGSGAAALIEQSVASWSHSAHRVSRHIERFYNHLRWVRYALGDAAIRFGDCILEDDKFDERRLRKPLALFADARRRRVEMFGLPRALI